MDKINWANYNYDEFEMFCNALLTFEIGKLYQPFSAPGRDGGIDGLFSGTYQNISGDWRFQFKFYQVPRSEGVANLRFKVKEEASKVNNENVFVLLTNVELLPQEQKNMIELFDSEIQTLQKKCTCFIWDGAKIFNIFLSFPILHLWLNDGFNTAQLQDYRAVFSKNLNTTEYDPSTFTNFFISRESDLTELSNFLTSDKYLALVTGEAGIGKTRLIIEFFKRYVDHLLDWTPLVLLNRNIEFDKIKKALASGNNYIILIDDAHNYKPEIISDMKALSDSLKGRVKLVLTARTLEAFNSLRLIKEYETQNILHIKLDELIREDTQEVFLHYIEHTDYKLFINELVITSFGKPILIVAILNAIHNRIPINKIKEQNFLRSYVTNYFNTYIEKVNHVTGIDRLNIKRLLQNVVLIEPFNFNDATVVAKISEIHGIQTAAVTEALKLLIDNGFVNGRYEQSVKPDYYSDILLSEIDQNEVPGYLTEFIPYVNNIIINLSSVDEVDKQNKNVLDEILFIYINLIKTGDDITAINKILRTVETISFIKPDVAKKAIEVFIECLTDDSHPITVEYRDNLKYSYQPTDTTINKAVAILANLYVYAVNFDFVFRSSFKLFSLIQEKRLTNIFNFTKRDVIEHFGMTRQNYFVQEFTKKLKKANEHEIVFGLSGLQSFLILDFTLSEWNAVNKDSLTITTYFVPANTAIKKLRKNVFDLLTKMYIMPSAKTARLEILKQILDIPRSIFATSRNSKPYKNDSEIKAVLDFLKVQAGGFDIIDQKEILDKLYWYQKWGISVSLVPLIEEVKSELKPKNLTERLSQLFSKAEISILEMPNVEKYIEDKCDEIVQSASETDLANSIVAFLEPQQYPPHYYWHFQHILERKYPSYIKILHDKMFNTSLKMYGMYGWRMLGTLYFEHRELDFYWNQVKVLQKLDLVEADNALLAVYSYRVPGRTTITKEDTAVILKVFNKKKKENNYGLATAIQSLYAASYADALNVSQEFLARAHQRETELFFIRLSDNTTITDHQMADLILNHTVRYYLTYEIERCLNLVLLKYGPDTIFDYLIRRYEFKKAIVITNKTLSGYEFVPDGEHSHLFDRCDPSVKIQMFIKSLDWYLNVDSEGGHLFYAKDLLAYLQPWQSLNSDLNTYYNQIIEDVAEDGDKLYRIADSLSVFHVKDDNLIQTAINVYNYGYEFKETNLETYKTIRSECYLAITQMGVKSGTAGVPFQVDLDLQSLLKIHIDQLPEYMPATQFLKDVLKSVNADIDRSFDRDNSTW